MNDFFLQTQQPSILTTPLKSIPSSCNVPGSSLKTPMKTPKQVQFNLQFQPATPSSKTIPCARSILKSPAFQSPRQSLNRTPHKHDVLVETRHHLVQVLDETNFGERHQLELSSPVKEQEEEERECQQRRQQHPMEDCLQVEPVDIGSIHDHSNDLGLILWFLFLIVHLLLKLAVDSSLISRLGDHLGLIFIYWFD